MEDSVLVRGDSLDAGSGCSREGIDDMTFDHEGTYPAASLEPSPAELAQCEVEVGTLLSIIAELSKKMGSLKAPSESVDSGSPGPSRPLVPDLLSHRLVRGSPERHTASAAASKPPLADQGGNGVVWRKMQEVLSSVEDSISCRRTWAVPITASDHYKHTEHLRAAQESWDKSTQILEEMEREFGISCLSTLPKDILDLEKHDPALRGTLYSYQEESTDKMQSQNTTSQMEAERKKPVGLHKAWRSDSCFPSYRPAAGTFTPDLASPPFSASPLLHRRTTRGPTPLSVCEDGSPMGSVNSGNPCPSPISLPESETEQLNRYIERLKARNERLTAALERKKGELEQNSITLNRLESDCSALQLSLKYCEECEEAYSELVSLYENKKQQHIPLQTYLAEADRQELRNPTSQLRTVGTEELSTSFSSAGVTEERETQSHSAQRSSDLEKREALLRQQIERLKRDRAAICLPKPKPGVESNLSPIISHPAGSRGGHVTKENIKPADLKKEKASLFFELISVREEMSDLRALIRLKEKELRCLEWSLMAQKAQESAGVFIPEGLREEVEGCKTEQQGLCETTAKLSSDGDVAGLQTRPILKELQALLQREQALKKRLALAHDSLNIVLSNGVLHRRENGEQIAQFTQAHSKVLNSYRQIRRKYREQVWRLEQKVAAIMESHQSHSGSPKTAEETMEWRRAHSMVAAIMESHQSHSGSPKTAEETMEWRREETIL
ncbi:uncharacterized protein ushbp1 isoform X2 [Echeneis naucrates]|uniref:Uncharacterized LOC115042480 n=1 Tax=Echeneis naucrates TaxID=173247 RepID=A0A665WUF7_ECHNA|nr:uncharacterized protein LOC115042480 isoform X2 [Echeneis naucrates]